MQSCWDKVYVETEWNLKEYGLMNGYCIIGRCRNRMEFKDQASAPCGWAHSRRCRNRMEFKVPVLGYTCLTVSVDVETEWNLKSIKRAYRKIFGSR